MNLFSLYFAEYQVLTFFNFDSDALTVFLFIFVLQEIDIV